MQSKVILVSTTFLLVLPTLYFYCFEFTAGSARQRILLSMFQSVTPRTAGFNTADLAAMGSTSQDVYKRQVKLCSETCCNVFQCDIIMPHFFRVSIAVVNRFDFLKRHHRLSLIHICNDLLSFAFRVLQKRKFVFSSVLHKQSTSAHPYC